MNSTKYSFVILDDFNIPGIKWDSLKISHKKYALHQLTNEPTK